MQGPNFKLNVRELTKRNFPRTNSPSPLPRYSFQILKFKHVFRVVFHICLYQRAFCLFQSLNFISLRKLQLNFAIILVLFAGGWCNKPGAKICHTEGKVGSAQAEGFPESISESQEGSEKALINPIIFTNFTASSFNVYNFVF